MILIVGPFPSKENEKDGMIQRVAAIDALMSDLARIYVHISFHRNASLKCHTNGQARIYRLNFFIHFLIVIRLIRQARLIYVHSAYNALKILPFFPKNKVIFDAHGIVPEELANEGRKLVSWVLALAERQAIKKSQILISVTQRMRDHFKEKYGRNNKADLICPILPRFPVSIESSDDIQKTSRVPGSVIYAGGLHSWQNVDKMIAACVQRPTHSYTFLTGDPTTLRSKLIAAKLEQVNCKSVPHQNVKDYYLTHTYGFILREPILINAVACPTKLIEYLYWGVIPIVITPKIGDFDEHKLRSLTLQDFIGGRLPSAAEEDSMRAYNREALRTLTLNAAHAEKRLVSLLTGKAPI